MFAFSFCVLTLIIFPVPSYALLFNGVGAALFPVIYLSCLCVVMCVCVSVYPSLDVPALRGPHVFTLRGHFEYVSVTKGLHQLLGIYEHHCTRLPRKDFMGAKYEISYMKMTYKQCRFTINVIKY